MRDRLVIWHDGVAPPFTSTFLKRQDDEIGVVDGVLSVLLFSNRWGISSPSSEFIVHMCFPYGGWWWSVEFKNDTSHLCTHWSRHCPTTGSTGPKGQVLISVPHPLLFWGSAGTRGNYPSHLIGIIILACRQRWITTLDQTAPVSEEQERVRRRVRLNHDDRLFHECVNLHFSEFL